MSIGHVRLRGHHLICLHFFGGGDYPEEFRHNVERVMQHFAKRHAVVERGPDDVCVHCVNLTHEGTCTGEPGGEASILGLDALAMELLGVKYGSHVRYEDVMTAIARVLDDWRRLACQDCAWERECAPAQDLMIRRQGA